MCFRYTFMIYYLIKYINLFISKNENTKCDFLNCLLVWHIFFNLGDNPCKISVPLTNKKGDALNCIGPGNITCPTGYHCVGTKTTSSVCCRKPKGNLKGWQTICKNGDVYHSMWSCEVINIKIRQCIVLTKENLINNGLKSIYYLDITYYMHVVW